MEDCYSGDDYYSGDEDYNNEEEDDYEYDDGDDPQPMETDKEYDFETMDDVRRCQDEVTAAISDQLSLPRGIAAALLRHCQWDPEHLQNEWFSDEARIRGAVGLTTASSSSVPMALNSHPLTCAICFDTYAAGEMRSAGCSHYYCHGCWRGYIHTAVTDGSRCLTLRCPDPSCPAPVVRELVDAVAGADDRARYATFVVRSFVEEGTNKYVRWCPGPGCTLAVRARQGSHPYEVPCPCCSHVFCFRCGEEAHRPATCETTREWVAKNVSDGETVRWVLANTKHCPKCHRAIEKNEGCNHMTCGPPCRHEFCWICLGSWAGHSGTNYTCNVYRDNPAEFDEATTRREQAKASLERYLHYYERWNAHGASMKKARQSLEALEGGGLDRLADDMGAKPTEMDFVLEAYEQIVEARRVLRWTYAYVYYLDPKRDEVKRTLCEYLQGEAESSLERLHHYAERRKTNDKEVEDEFEVYQERLSNFKLVTRNHFSKLVEGFESGLAEVVS